MTQDETARSWVSLADLDNGLMAAARSDLDRLREIRRTLHRKPEIGLDTVETQAVIVGELTELGLSPVLGRSLASVNAWIPGDATGPVTLLRADMDALPIQERTELAYASRHPGVMHACGHDLHVASLLGAARLLVTRQNQLPGPVLLMFQPGEEGYDGARRMIAEGLLDGLDSARVRALALHVWTRHPTGSVHIRSGPMMASNDNFHITIVGRGGHGSAPHLATDPIAVAAQVVTSLYASMAREVAASDRAVLSVCQIDGGTAQNVIPDVAQMIGTCRTLSRERRAAMAEMIERVASNVAAAHGARAVVEMQSIVPVTVNDEQVAARLGRVAGTIVGGENVHTLPAAEMSAEDFAFVLEQVPGCLAWVGARSPCGPDSEHPGIHSDSVVFDEDAIAVAAAVFAAFTLSETHS